MKMLWLKYQQRSYYHLLLLLWGLIAFCSIAAVAATQKSFVVREEEEGKDTQPRKINKIAFLQSSKLSDHATNSWNDEPDRDDDIPECDEASTYYDPLICWLWKLDVCLPDQSFKKSLVTVKVTDLCCGNFAMDRIDFNFTYILPKRHTTRRSSPSIELAAMGMTAVCSGNYHVSGGASGNLSLKPATQVEPAIRLRFAFNSSSSNDVSVEAMATPKKTSAVVTLITEECETHLKGYEIHFTGSASAMVANLFSSLIEDGVGSKLNDSFCQTKELQEVDLTIFVPKWS